MRIRTAFSVVCSTAALWLLLACGGGGGSSAPAPQPPAAPQLSVPTQISSGKAGTASVQSPSPSLTYSWTISGGTFAGAALTATGSSVTFTAGAPGSMNLACTARDSGGLTSSATSVNVTVLALPTITSLTANPAIVTAGQHSFVTGVFSHGTGKLNPGDLTLVSGTPLDVGVPSGNTTYTLVVTNPAGDSVQQTVTVLVAGSTPTFLPTGSLLAGTNHLATLLADGRVLISGGGNSATVPAERYDPGTGVFTPVGMMQKARVGHTATLLNNGKVLIAGGDETGPTTATRSTTELFDPSTGTFSAGPLLATVRFRHSATLLPDGKVLIAGGQRWTSATYDFVDTAELYDPVTNSFTATTGNLGAPRGSHTATLLNTGKVLLAAGVNLNGRLDTAELFDPSSGTFSATAGKMTLDRVDHTATLLANGKVLIVGDNMARSAQAELYDPATGTFSATGSLAQFRSAHQAVRLTQGKVLIVGGARNDTHATIQVAELYDPATGTFSATASLSEGRERFSATLLNTGMVLVAGGWTQTAEVYSPAEPAP